MQRCKPKGGETTDTDTAFTMSSGDAARVLGVTPQAVRDMARRGELSHETRTQGTRHYFYFKPDDVRAYADELADARRLQRSES